jgi:hypothetical protein
MCVFPASCDDLLWPMSYKLCLNISVATCNYATRTEEINQWKYIQKFRNLTLMDPRVQQGSEQYPCKLRLYSETVHPHEEMCGNIPQDL